MRILSIDHASRSGWSLIENGEVLETGFIELQGEHFNRFSVFNKLINKLMMKTNPTMVVVEEAKHLRNIKVLRYLVGLYTIVVTNAYDMGLDIAEVNPKLVKKYIVGNGGATKEEVMTALIERYRVPKEFIYKPIYYKKNPKKIKDYLFDESDATANGLYVCENLS